MRFISSLFSIVSKISFIKTREKDNLMYGSIYFLYHFMLVRNEYVLSLALTRFTIDDLQAFGINWWSFIQLYDYVTKFQCHHVSLINNVLIIRLEGGLIVSTPRSQYHPFSLCVPLKYKHTTQHTYKHTTLFFFAPPAGAKLVASCVIHDSM